MLPLAALGRGSLAVAGGKAANLGELSPPASQCPTASASPRRPTRWRPRLPAWRASSTPSPRTRRGRGGPSWPARCVRGSWPRRCRGQWPRPSPRPTGGWATATGRRWQSAPPPPPRTCPPRASRGSRTRYLHVVGVEAVLDAVRRCWASLWTDRAVSYRATNGIEHRSVRLAVVVQRMVDASGRRRALHRRSAHRPPAPGRDRRQPRPGRGDRLGRGQPRPLRRPPGHRRRSSSAGSGTSGWPSGPLRAAARGGSSCPTRAASRPSPTRQVRRLAALGARVEAHYGAPQDTEWALDADGRDVAHPGAPDHDAVPAAGRRARRPTATCASTSPSTSRRASSGRLTPMGVQAFRLLGLAMAACSGCAPTRPAGRARASSWRRATASSSTSRPVLHDRLGRRIILAVTGLMEARSAAVLRALVEPTRA